MIKLMGLVTEHCMYLINSHVIRISEDGRHRLRACGRQCPHREEVTIPALACKSSNYIAKVTAQWPAYVPQNRVIGFKPCFHFKRY